jgi:hypothetical protein
MTQETAINSARPPVGMNPEVDHTRTPWKKGVGRHDDGHTITSPTGAPVAFFQNQSDRDLALYFVNVHDGVVRVLEECADKFDFIARGSKAHDGTAACATQFAATARTYAEILRKAGRVEGTTTMASGTSE